MADISTFLRKRGLAMMSDYFSVTFSVDHLWHPFTLVVNGKETFLSPLERSHATSAAVVLPVICEMGALYFSLSSFESLGLVALGGLAGFYLTTGYYKTCKIRPIDWLAPDPKDGLRPKMQRAYFASLYKSMHGSVADKASHWLDYSDQDDMLKQGSFNILFGAPWEQFAREAQRKLQSAQ